MCTFPEEHSYFKSVGLVHAFICHLTGIMHTYEENAEAFTYPLLYPLSDSQFIRWRAVGDPMMPLSHLLQNQLCLVWVVSH